MDCGHSVEDSVVLPIFQRIASLHSHFFLGEINFPSDGLGGCNVKIGFA